MNPKFMLDMTCKCERPADVAPYMFKEIAESFEYRFCRVKALGRRMTFRTRWWMPVHNWFWMYFSQGVITVSQTSDGIRLTGWLGRSHLRCAISIYLAFLLAAAVLGAFVFCGFFLWSIGMAVAIPAVLWLEKSEIHIFFRKRFKEAMRQMEADLKRHSLS
jgi:hypothetical protein